MYIYKKSEWASHKITWSVLRLLASIKFHYFHDRSFHPTSTKGQQFLVAYATFCSAHMNKKLITCRGPGLLTKHLWHACNTLWQHLQKQMKTHWGCCGKSHVAHLTLYRRQAEVKPLSAVEQTAQSRKSTHVRQTPTYLHRKTRYNWISCLRITN